MTIKCVFFNPMYMESKCSSCEHYVKVICANCEPKVCFKCHKSPSFWAPSFWDMVKLK